MKHTKIPKYIIFGPVKSSVIKEGSKYIEDSGGAIVLALLMEKLNSLGVFTTYIGYDVYNNINPELKQSIENGDTIVIYPESIDNNPLNGKKVVRWILYYTEYEKICNWEKSGNLIYYYWENFHPFHETKQILNLVDIGIDRFYDKNLKRDGICYRLSKGHLHIKETENEIIQIIKKDLKMHKLNYAIDVENEPIDKIEDAITRNQMQELFNKYKLFISYDTDSAVSIIAVLCGCISVINPRIGLKLDDLLPCFKYGIAYGIENIDHAMTTMPLVKGHLIEINNWGIKSLEQFVRLTSDNMDVWK